MVKIFIQYGFIFIIFFFAVVIRTIELDKYPLPMNQDEISNAYDAYSLAKTGKDRFGNTLPVTLRAYGTQDYRPPLYAYFTSLFFVNSNEFSVTKGRLTSSIFGILSIVLLFIFVRRFIDPNTSLLVLILICIQPWHTLFSRIAHEGSILPTFFFIAILLLYHVAKSNNFRNKYLIFLGFIVGLSTNVYQSTRFTGAVFSILIIFLLIFELRNISINKKNIIFKCLYFLVFCVLGASPQIYMLLIDPDHFISRANGVRLSFSNPIQYLFSIVTNVYRNLSPEFLFLSNFNGNYLSINRLIPFEFPFFYVGFFYSFWFFNDKKVRKVLLITYVFLFISLIPSALTTINPHAIRSSQIMIIMPLFTAVGIKYIKIIVKVAFKSIINSWMIKFIYNFIIWILLIVIFIKFFIDTRNYMMADHLKNQTHRYELVLMSTKLKEIERNYDRIIVVEPFDNQTYMYITAFSGIKPKEFQKMEKKWKDVGFDSFIQMGKYHFIEYDNLDNQINKKTINEDWLVLFRNQIPPFQMNLVYTSSWYNDTIYFMEIEKKSYTFFERLNDVKCKQL